MVASINNPYPRSRSITFVENKDRELKVKYKEGIIRKIIKGRSLVNKKLIVTGKKKDIIIVNKMEKYSSW